MSVDAVACTVNVAELIIGQMGHYLLALKKNQKQLYEQVSEHMQRNKQVLEQERWQDFGSGRLEERVCYVCDRLELLDGLEAWPAISRVVMVEASVEKDGVVKSQTRFYLSSLPAGPEEFNRLVRGHWGVENNLHWVLDVVFGEDQSRTRKGNGAENLATARKMALQLLNQQADKQSIKSRRKIAAWNDDYLFQMLQNLRF